VLADGSARSAAKILSPEENLAPDMILKRRLRYALGAAAGRSWL
jgi:hypothetical protein